MAVAAVWHTVTTVSRSVRPSDDVVFSFLSTRTAVMIKRNTTDGNHGNDLSSSIVHGVPLVYCGTPITRVKKMPKPPNGSVVDRDLSSS